MTTLDRLVDTRPLRENLPYRWLWIGGSTSTLGYQVAFVAILFQVWQLTGSPFWVGAVGVAQAVPKVVGALFGGTLADAVDRRRLVLATSTGGIVGSVLLASQAASGLDSIPVVLSLIAWQSLCNGLGAPARKAFVPRLLPRDQVAAGIALTHISFQAAMLAGPALGGLVVAGWGVAACYVINAMAAAVSWYGVFRLPAMPPLGEAASPGLRATVAGWRFVLRRPVLRGAFLTDLSATLFAMPIALFPMINEERFGGDPRTLGLFLSAIAAGGIAAGLSSGTVTRYPRPGRVMLTAAALWGAALAGFGFAAPLWLALGLLAVAGAADTVSVISRGAIVQLSTPDSHRGRVSAVDHTIGAAVPDLGNFRAGLVAGLTSGMFALVSGGLLSLLAVAAIAARNRPLRQFDSTAEVHTDPPR